MTIKVVHTGTRASFPIKNVDAFQGFYDPAESLQTAYHLSLKAGKIVAVDTDGKIKLADGATDFGIGFLLNDFIEYDLGSNTPVADGGLAVMTGNCHIVTNQIDTDLTYTPGEKLYAGTGTKVGLLTNVAPSATSPIIAIAKSTASSSNPNLSIARV